MKIMKAPWPLAQQIRASGTPCLGTSLPAGWVVDENRACYDGSGRRIDVYAIRLVSVVVFKEPEHETDLCGCGCGGDCGVDW